MELNDKERELFLNYVNGNIAIFRQDLNKLSKRELINFIYNVQEQSLREANEILSICFKYINE
jgi:hypothetical protein